MASTIDKIRDYRNRRKSDDINSETINRIRQYRAQKAESEVNSLIEKYNEDNKTLSSLQLSDESSYNSFRDKLENQQKNMSRLNYLLDTHGAFYDNEFTKSLRRSLDSSKTAYDGAIKLFDTYKTYDDYARATASSDDWKAKRDEVQSRLDLIEDNAPDKSKDWANLSRSERIRRMDEYQNNLDGKGKQLSELWDEYNTYYHQALQVETAQKLKDAALNAEDFKKYSDIGAGIENPTMQEAEGYFLQIGKKKFGAKPIGNIVTYSRENSGEIKARSREDGTVYGNYLYSHLTDDETAAYNYYLAKDIENGTNLSDEYLKEMQYTLNAREGAALAENLEDKEALKYVFALAYAGPDQWASGIKGFISQIKGSDDYIAPSPVQFASPAVRESIESQFGRGAYDLSVTVGNQIPNILISSAFGKMAGLTTMGASASGNAYAEMINNGYDKGQANAYAALTGLSETTLQYLLGGISSLGGLTDDVLSGAIDNVVRGMNRANLQIAAKYGMKLGASMLSEGFEEGLQEVLDPIFKNAVLGTHENVNWGDVAYSAVLGALSAGVLEGAGTSVEAADTFVQSERVSKAMNTDGFTDTVKNVGVTYAADTVSYKLASKIDENSTSYDVLELLRAEGAELSEQNRAQLKTSMTESGISSKDAEIILNYASGFLSDDVKLTENMIYGLNIAEPFADALRQLVKENTPLNQTVSQITERTEQYGDLIERVKSSKGTKSITEAIDEESSVLTQQALTELPDTEISRNTAENQKVAKTDTQSDKDTLPRVKRITEITKNVGSDGSVRFIPHVELEDGNTASGAHEYNSDDAQLVEAISGMGYDIQTANAVFSMARANNIPAARADDMTLIYELGYQHAPDSAFELISSFAPAQVEYLRRLGESARSKRNSTVKGGAETIERSGGKIIDDTDGSAQANELKNLRREQLDYIRALTAVVGGKVHIFNSVKDESGNFVAAKTLAEGRVAKKGEKAPNGAFDSVTGDIYIDLNAGNYGEGLMMYALAHEYTHSIRMYNTDMFDRLSDFIIEEMYGKNINVNELVHERMEKAGLDFDTAFEEVISDSLEEMLVSENAAQHLKNLYKSDKSLYSRLVDKIRQLLQAFKKVFEQYKNRSDAGLSQEARILREISRAEYDKLSQLYAQALKGMSQTDEQNNGTKKLSENKNIKTSPAREGQSFSPKSSGGALINDDNLSQRKQLVNGSSALDEDTALYSIRYTEDNQPVAVIDKNILADVPKSRWVKTIKRMLTEKFRGGVPISGRLIKINYITRSEYTNSKYSRYLRDNDVEKYNDKLKSANNIDDVVLASTNYVNEDLKHARKDNFKEFARGSVLIKIGDKSYTAKVIVGFTSGGEMVLYDIIDFNLTDLKLKKDTPYDQTLSKIVRSGMSSDNTVSQKDQSVNSNYMRESEKHSDNGKVKYKLRKDNNGNEYWQVESENDIFSNIKTTDKLKKAAYDLILHGEKGNKFMDLIDGKSLEFTRVSAKEYVYGRASKALPHSQYRQKMRMSPSIADLVENASIHYDAPDHKNHKLFPDGFKNYQGRVGIDNTIFRYIVRIGKAKNGMIFYDINLEVDGKVPHAKSASLIKKTSTSDDNTVSQKDQSVNSNYTRESADNTETDDIVLKGSDGKTVRFSDRIDFSQQVDNVLKNTHDKNNHVYLGQTPVRLREILGIKNLPMLMTGSHVYSICVSQERAEKDGRLNNKLHYHDLGEKTVKKLPAALNEPVLIIKSDNDDANLNFVVVTRLSDKKGNPVIVAIKPDGKGNYMDMRIDSTVALSAYGRSNIMSYIARARQEDRILYADKKYNRQKHNPPGAQFTNDIMSADYYRQHNSPGAQFTNEIMTADYDKSLSHYKALVNSNYMQNSLENSLENMDRQKNSGYNESDYNRGTDVDEAELKAQLRETKFSSRTSETEENPLGFESRAEPVKNSSINWVYKAKIFSQAENRLFHQKIAEIRSGDRSFEKNADGEYMLPIANKIVFTNGDWEAPYIRQIIEVFTAYGDEFEEIKEIIFNVEKGKSRKSEAVRAFEDLQIAGRTYVYTDKNDGVYAWEDGKRSGRTRREANRNYINKLYRERNGFKSEDAAREYARLYELYNGVKLSSRDYGNRYIEESPAVQQAAEDENAKLREEISYLKELVKIQGKLTHGQKFTRSSVKIALNKIIRDAGLDISADRAPAVQMLNSLYEYVAAGDNLNWQSLRGHAQPLIDWINEHDRRKNDDISESEHRYNAAERESLLFESIYENYWAVTTLHTVADKYQGRINRLKANHRQKMAEITALHRERIDTLRRESRERLDKKTAELNMRHRESLERSRRERKKTELRHKILRRVNQLNKLLLHGDKEHHVPRSLSKPTAEILSTVNMDTVNAQKRLAKLRERIEKATDPAVIARLNAAYTRVEEQGYNIARRLEVLDRAYDELKNSDSSVSVAYDRNISDMITELKEQVGNTPLREMTLEQLEKTDSVYKMVLHIIRTANKTFKEQRQATVEQLGREVMTQIYATGGSKKYSIKALDSLKKFTWLNAKPVYAMRAIGSKTLEQLFDNVRAGEDVWAVDVSEAREYFLDKVKKYGYRTWDFKRRYDFQSVSGREFSLSLGEIMSLYAYSKRPQAHDHLSKGGFVLDSSVEVEKKVGGVPVKYKVNTADAYNITDEIMSDIISTLSSEQRKFADDMQRYLSDVMGQKGNEVSRVMYDIDMFTEKNYFPLRSAKQYLYEQNETVGEVRVKNSGFTKKTVPSANNPIILKNFTDVWAEHVDAMSMYHAFVLPLEDFNRVFNYKTPSTQMSDTKSVKTALQNAYGRHAADYIKQMLVDLNGGATSQQGTEISNKLISLFKKGAVFASASVVIQQPSAIARAMAYIDPKYFASALPSSMNFKNHTADWNEIKKYAPVAIIKEMGYFDTNVGKRTVDWITASEYVGFSQKARALVTDSGFRDEVLSRAPAIADEAAWVHIWNAVKREQQSNGGAITDGEFLIRCGKRFTEVVVNTQVYDSVLSRSALMRSKDTGVKMATSFMAEPATSLNMLADAIIQVRRGGKSAVKSASQQVGAVVASMILNSILVAFVYGARDEEDESYLERYKKALVGSLADNLNPLNLVPYINDIVSIAQGYDVERSDMSIVSDLWSAFEKLGNDNVPPYKKAEDFAGSVAALFGLPLKNIMRDTRAIWNNTAGVIDPTLKMRSGSTSNTYQTALYNAVRDGNGDITDKIIEISVTDRIEEKTQEYVLSGKDRKEAEKIAESSVRASFTVYWKPLYLEAYNKNDTEQTAVIRRLLNETGLYEDIVQTCSNWVKSPKE
ncbi:MAG: hypothetical protein J6K66_05165 [Clostridia bacterium]|nr:hypothetical protein [Clostridia bacterium]